MNEQTGKWGFLLPFVNEAREANPELTLASIARIAKEEFQLGLDAEALRKIISRLVNQSGDQNTSESYVKPSRIPNPYQVSHPVDFSSTTFFPKTQPTNITGCHIPGGYKIEVPGRYLVLGCWHVPFHNKQLTNRLFDLMSTEKFDGIILNGDFMDLNSLSGHDRGKFTAMPGLNLNEEYAEGRKAIEQIRDLLPPDAIKIYLYGNHEDRYHRYIADMQNAKTPPVSPTEGLRLFENGFMVNESYSSGYITLGDHLDILHGIYYNTHCAKAHIDKFRGSVLFAHTHRVQSYIEGRTGGFNIGWGGDVTHRAFNYADRGTKASWQNGFAEVLIDEHGDYYVNQITCNNSRFVYGGKLY
jgi:hypothetical protein